MIFKKYIEEFLKDAFFPFTTIENLHEKVALMGYTVIKVKANKTNVFFAAVKKTEIVDFLCFGVSLKTKELTALGLASAKGFSKNQYGFVSDLKENIYKDFIGGFDKFISRSTIPSTSIKTFYYHTKYLNKSTIIEDEYSAFFYSNIKYNTGWVLRNRNKLLLSSILKMIKYFYTKKTFYNELPPVKKRKLREDIFDEIFITFMKARESSYRILNIISGHGKAYIGLYLFPLLIEKIDIENIEDLIDDIKEHFFIAMRERLLAVQTLNYLNSNSLKNAYQKYFGSVIRISQKEQASTILNSAFSFHKLLDVLENEPAILEMLFSDDLKIGYDVKQKLHLNNRRNLHLTSEKKYEVKQKNLELETLYHLNDITSLESSVTFDEDDVPF